MTRIAIGGIHIESSTFNPVLSRGPDFRVLRGKELLDDGAFRFLADSVRAEFLPTIHCRAMPGGPVEHSAYVRFRSEFLERLAAAGPVDGLYLAMHGAMFVEGMEDAEADWIEAARKAVGPDVPIAASYDLHGNLSARILDAIDMFSAYRTAPHIDVRETMLRAARMLERAVNGRERPSVTWAPIPVLLPGERTSTVDEPAAGLYRRLEAISARPGIWDASLLVGYVWADEPRATAAAVMTGTNPGEMAREACRLAGEYWEARERFGFGAKAETIEKCLDLAARSATHPVVVSDSGDNPTGGGVGDRPDVLRAILARGASSALVAAIADPASTALAHATGAGGRANFLVGAGLDPSGGPPVSLEAEVAALSEDAAGREAVLRRGGIRIVVSDRRRAYHHLSDFSRLGLDPHEEALVVLKLGYLPPELAAIARPHLLALSPGVVDQDVTRARRARMTRPIFPFDRTFEWTPRAISSRRTSP